MPDSPDDLPRPRRLARALLRWSQGPDAKAFVSDLAESLDRRGRTGVARWATAWREILSTVRPMDGDLDGIGSSHRRGPDGRRPGGIGLRPWLALRLAVRGLRRDPTTASTAVLILALGLAAPVVFFSVLWGLAGRPLPVQDGDRIVRIEVRQPDGSGRTARITGTDVDMLRELPEFEAVGGFTSGAARVGADEGPATAVASAQLDPEVFRLLGVDPLLGRLPGPDEAETAWLMGHDGWVRAFGADSVVVGRSVRVDGSIRTVVGVMPQDFGFPLQHDGWTVRTPDPDAPVQVVAKLARGVTEERADEAVARVWAAGDAARPMDTRDARPRVLGYTAARGEGGELVLFVALVVVGIALLVIATANASNLLLVRATDRSGAMAVQAALGAGRAQLALQVVLESLLLAGAGGVLGLGLAALGADYVQATLGPRNFGYYWIQVGIAPAVALFTALLVLGSGLLAGSLPVLRVMRTSVGNVMTGTNATGGSGGTLGRRLVTLQLALSCGALVATGLTVQSTRAARSFGDAVAAESIVMLEWTLDDEADPGALPLRTLRDALERARPGPWALATGAPGYFERSTAVHVADAPVDPDRPEPGHPSNVVEPAYFPMMDIDLLQGRMFGPGDVGGTPPVAIVNESWAARHLPVTPPVGTVVRIPDRFGDRPVTIVGVVEDVPLSTGAHARLDRIYTPFSQVAPRSGMILLGGTDPTGALARVRTELNLDGLSMSPPRTLAEGHRYMTRVHETFGVLVLIGGLFGLVVATAGLYGLLSFRIRQRRTEFGIRLALGADGATLTRSVLRVALRQILPAVLLGTGLAWVCAPVLGMIMVGQDPRDPVVYGAVAGIFTIVALITAWIPARRAGGIDPMKTLRADG